MGRVLRINAAIVLLAALAGCNMVVSKEPWFTAADAVPEPTLRDGLWLSASSDCRVDETKPAERWPDCADGFFVRGKESWSMRWQDTDERGRHRRTFGGWEPGDPTVTLFVANGDHLIAQSETGNGADGLPADEVDPDAADSDSWGYMYFAIRVVGRDEAGNVTAIETWPIQCGPRAQPEPTRDRRRRHDAEMAEEANYVTTQPFPGLTVNDHDCVAESVVALRNAAVLSQALAPPYEMRWVREGWR